MWPEARETSARYRADSNSTDRHDGQHPTNYNIGAGNIGAGDLV
jgi:hypothetical protein